MNKLLLIRRASRLVLSCALVALGLFASVQTSNAQAYSIVPKLNLTGNLSGYNTDWYPDGRIWVPPSTTSPREFLMPVFIDNQWAPKPTDSNTVMPIRSFEFKILYDSSSVRAIGIQTEHPFTQEEATNPNRNDRRFTPWYEPLAKGFHFSTFDEKDTNYTKYMFPNRKGTDEEPMKGRSFRIVASSASPLPNTSLTEHQYRVLLYVVFRVIDPRSKPSLSSDNSPIVIDNDVIRYNGINIRKERIFPDNNYPLPTAIEFDADGFTNKAEVTGLTGLRNDLVNSRWLLYPERYLPGVIQLKVMTKTPEFAFKTQNASGYGSSLELIRKEADGLFILVNPITVDNTDIAPQFGSKIVQVKIPDELGQTRLKDITIQSDEPWLSFKSTMVGTQSKNPIPSYTRKGYINFIDFGILGELEDPAGLKNTKDLEVHLEIKCDPSQLVKNNPNDPEKEGVYTGYVTFKSPYAGITPVKLKITFIYFKRPIEPTVTTNIIPGIKLTVTNTDKSAPNGAGYKHLLIFGTGVRATDGIDSLYGECAHEYPLGKDAQGNDIFDARWFPVDSNLLAQYPNGFWDFAPNEANRRSHSRDIRDFDFTAKSHVFLSKFSPNKGYPVVLTWNVNDFYPGSNLFIHDTKNGEYFPAINMRKATDLGNGNFSFTIFDPKVTEFMIEYTLPTVVDYVNSIGEPIIQEGWNLLSMPVRPVNAFYLNFYRNAINIPMTFTQNQYQEPPDGVLKPGTGYFIKYDKVVDRQFPGTFIYDLDVNTPPNDVIRLYSGWNTIGAVSIPLNINEIQFTEFNGETPDISYTRQYGVWAYVTNRGYQEVSEIRPGLGYWIKVNNSGHLKINVPANLRRGFKLNAFNNNEAKDNLIATATQVTVSDNVNKNANVYISSNINAYTDSFEMPPAPLSEIFDVRFVDGKYLSNANESVVRVQGVQYPINVNLNNADADYTFVDAVTGEIFGTIKKGSNSSLTIKGTSFDAFKVIKSETTQMNVSLAAYPNPVSNTSNVSFASVENELVTVKLFDALGNEVLTLVNEVLPIGNHSATLNTSAFVNGNYFLKLTAGTRTEVVKLNIVK